MLPDDIFSTFYPVEPYDKASAAAEEPKPEITDPGAFPAETPIAMAYVPMQRFVKLYEPERGFDVGTLYEELNKPFLGGRGGANE